MDANRREGTHRGAVYAWYFICFQGVERAAEIYGESSMKEGDRVLVCERIVHAHVLEIVLDELSEELIHNIKIEVRVHEYGSKVRFNNVR